MAKQAKDKEEKVTWEALLTVTSAQGTESIRTFDRAWHRSKELARETLPVTTSFVRFVRKD